MSGCGSREITDSSPRSPSRAVSRAVMPRSAISAVSTPSIAARPGCSALASRATISRMPDACAAAMPRAAAAAAPLSPSARAAAAAEARSSFAVPATCHALSKWVMPAALATLAPTSNPAT